MIVSKITVNNNLNCKPRKMVSSDTPTFEGRCPACRPIIENVNGEKLFLRAIKLIDAIPEGAKMTIPSHITLSEGNLDKVYGVIVDKKTLSNSTQLIIKDVSKNAEWENVNSKKDVFKAVFDNKSGRMISADYDEMHFYRNSNNRERKMVIGNTRYAPDYYGSSNWKLTTYGTISQKLDKTVHDKETLGSIFWAMTAQGASIKAK